MIKQDSNDGSYTLTVNCVYGSVGARVFQSHQPRTQRRVVPILSQVWTVDLEKVDEVLDIPIFFNLVSSPSVKVNVGGFQ